MLYLKTTGGQEIIVDDEKKVIAIKGSPNDPWIRTTKIIKKHQEVLPLMILEQNKQTTLLICKEKVEGLVKGSNVGEYSSAPDLSDLTVDIAESEQFRTKKVDYGGMGKIIMEKDFSGVTNAINMYGIELVVDSMFPLEVAILIHHLRKSGQSDLGNKAYERFQRYIYGSHAFTDQPNEYMQDFNAMIERNGM
ncbi:MAG: hypothetical protein PHD81_04140 [Candidatus Nanoarchaeia archaeon]|nr:hypothetical protein [Candidatus Nanoarchaeia archaeon]MDD5588272.1 hypothetical protein [Candidatus Nanoarchaeia archaeon]